MLASPLPDCSPLYTFLILPALSCVGVFAGLNLTLFIFYSWGSLISWSNYPCPCYPYVSRKATPTYSFVPSYERCTIGQSNSFGNSTATKYYFSLIFVFSYAYHHFFFNKGFATSPRKEAAADAISPKGMPLPICFLIYRVFFPNILNTFSYRLFSPHSNKSPSV